MPKRKNISAGLLLFHRVGKQLEVFLAHPGGPFWAKRDAGAWSIPKGLVDPEEELLAAACREFEEETGIHPQGPFLPLGNLTQKSGKVVHAWAWEGDAEPRQVTSNLVRLEWPKGSGRQLEFPEVDRCTWFDLPSARKKILAGQVEFLDRLDAGIQGRK